MSTGPPHKTSNFYFSFLPLSGEKKRAIHSIYAYCRRLDDLADHASSTEEAINALSRWKEETNNMFKGKTTNPLMKELKQYIDKYNIPEKYFLELIKGVEMDLTINRYKTFEELHKYCYRVASVVGLMCIEVFGYKNPTTMGYAVDLGIAMQLTNILRDVKTDAMMGRIYIPLEDMKKFEYGEKDLLAFKYNQAFIKLMKFESERAWSYYNRAVKTLPKEDRKSMIAAEIMRKIYSKLLQKIESLEYDVFSRPIHLSTFTKLSIAIRSWIENIIAK